MSTLGFGSGTTETRSTKVTRKLGRTEVRTVGGRARYRVGGVSSHSLGNCRLQSSTARGRISGGTTG